MSDPSHFLTVVFEIKDKQKFANYSKPFFESMGGTAELPGSRVTAISLADEISRVERF